MVMSEQLHICDQCQKKFLFITPLCEVRDLHQRVCPGYGVVPSGQCPQCGALVYPVLRPVEMDYHLITVSHMAQAMGEQYSDAAHFADDLCAAIKQVRQTHAALLREANTP